MSRAVGSALWRPADVGDFVVALPGSGRAAFGGRGRDVRVVDDGCDGGGVVLVDQVPEENEAVVCAGGENAAAVGGPFHAVHGGRVAFELEERLTRLAYI